MAEKSHLFLVMSILVSISLAITLSILLVKYEIVKVNSENLAGKSYGIAQSAKTPSGYLILVLVFLLLISSVKSYTMFSSMQKLKQESDHRRRQASLREIQVLKR